jgi:ABC-type transport system involved in multi-copper enzyme maturation permease subunit
MTRTMQICKAFIVAGLLETLRRKDLYVVLILTVLMVAGAWMFGFFGVRGLEVFIRDVTLSAIGVFSTILTIMIAGRQVPEEIARKTIYPLMARPITRWQILLGKWLTASITSILCFLVLAALGRALLMAFGIPVGPIFYQYLLLKQVGLLWLSAMTVALSVYMTPAANITICLILAFGSGIFTRFTLLWHGETGATGASLNFLYGLLPHYDFFDLGAKVTYAWPPIGAVIVLSLAAYGILGSFLWLGVGWLRFRKAVL